MLLAREAVQLQVPARPVEVGVREIDRHRFPGAARDGVDRGRARVTEQIEEALAFGLRADQLPHGSMVEEEARVEVVGEVHEEAEASLTDFVEGSLVAEFLVLSVSSLALTHLEVDVGGEHAQHARDGGERRLKPPLGLVRLDGLGRGILLDVHPALIEVNGQGVVGQIGVIDAKAAHIRAARPLRQVAEVLGQSVDEPLRFLAHPGGGWWHSSARGLFGSGVALTLSTGARSLPRVDRNLQESALDRAVVEDVAAPDAQADLFGQGEVSREDVATPAREALLQDIAQAAIKPAERADLAQALAVGRIGHQDAARDTFRPRGRREFALFEAEVLAKPRPPGIGPRGMDGRGVHVKALDAHAEVSRGPPIARARLLDERGPERAVVLEPAREARWGTHQPWGNVGGHQTCLDGQRARSAHGIDETSALRHHLGPAGEEEDGSRQVLLEGRERALHPVTAAVQALARQIDAQGGDVSIKIGVDPQIWPFELDGRSRPARLAESIDDRVLDLERAKVRVRHL